MKTKDFIKLLQEADPSGEAHLRMCDGVPIYVILKEGYWDGPYSYLDEDGRYVDSTQGSKIDVYFKEPEDIVSEVIDDWNPYEDSEDGLWEKVKDRFKFDYSYLPESTEEKKERFFSRLAKHFEWYLEFQKESWDNNLKEVLQKYKDGWKFYQEKDEGPNGYYSWIIIDSDGKNKGACMAITYPILKSGIFKMSEKEIKGSNLIKKPLIKKFLSDGRDIREKTFREWEVIKK